MAECPATPPNRLEPVPAVLSAGEVIYRIHDAEYAAVGFNPGYGIGRFHPMTDQEGRPVPTLYGALDFETALCEALFRGRPPGSVIPASKVKGLCRSLLRTNQAVTLVNLYGRGLEAIGAPASALIESPERCYPATARWASAIYPCAHDACGMIWRSRQRPDTDAMVFWQPRMPRDAFDVIEKNTPLDSPALLQRVRELADLHEILIPPSVR